MQQQSAVWVCRQCGCKENDACLHPDYGPCWWVEPNLCSHCHLWPGESQRYSQTVVEDNDGWVPVNMEGGV
jgi:hypothetical protein